MQQQPELEKQAGHTLLLIDWDNFFYGLLNRFGIEKMDMERRIQKLIEKIEKKMGGLLGGHGFVFAPGHLTPIHQEMCARNKLWLMTCPKKQLQTPRKNPKSGKMESRVDTVDETIIKFANMMVGHLGFRTICLVSGDKDYVPLFQEMGRLGIKRALAPPAINSLARDTELINLVDKTPMGRKMLIMLDKI